MTYPQEQYDALLAVCKSYRQDVEQLTEERNRYAETLAKYQIASDKEIAAQVKQLKTECTLLDDELRNARQETINVLNKLKEKYGFYSCYSFSGDVKSLNEIIDEFIKEVLNAENKD